MKYDPKIFQIINPLHTIDKNKMMKTDPALSAAAAAHHQLMTSHHHHKLNEVTSVAGAAAGNKSNDKSVKAEPLEQMSIYSSHFAAAAAAKPPHPLTGMPQHDSAGMLTGKRKNTYLF